MKTRMNEVIRDAMLIGLLNHRFKPLFDALDKVSEGIADMLYTTVLTAKERRQIKAAPPGWFQEKHEVYFNVDGKSYNFNFREPRRVPFAWSRYEHRLHFAGSSEFGAYVLKYYADKAALEEQRDKARMAVKATIATFRYLEDLVEAWPESKQFVPKDTKKALTVALAIPPRQLNQMLGLV